MSQCFSDSDCNRAFLRRRWAAAPRRSRPPPLEPSQTVLLGYVPVRAETARRPGLRSARPLKSSSLQTRADLRRRGPDALPARLPPVSRTSPKTGATNAPHQPATSRSALANLLGDGRDPLARESRGRASLCSGLVVPGDWRRAGVTLPPGKGGKSLVNARVAEAFYRGPSAARSSGDGHARFD